MITHATWRFMRVQSVRAVPSLLVLGLCVWALGPYLTADMAARVAAQVADVPGTAWGLALAATAASFWAVGRYDAVAHRHLRTGIDPASARIAGGAAIALGQALGCAMLTSALVRWRLFPGLGLRGAAALSGFVSVSFLVAWCVVAALACVLLPSPPWTHLPAALILLSLAGAAALMTLRPVLSIGRVRVRWPSLRACAMLVCLAAIDTGFAALALYVLLPPGTDVGFTVFFPLFLLALGAALISNTPGGIGPFELMLLALLPGLPEAQVLGSIAAFRLVYYALPAALGMLALIRPLPGPVRATVPDTRAILSHAPRAEVGVIAQNGGRLEPTADGWLAVWPTAQTLTALCDPPRGSAAAALDALQRAARCSDRIPVVYKCTARMAHRARARGWRVLHTADDAVLNLDPYDLNAPARARLRRKLRSAAKAGIRVMPDVAPPAPALAQIDAAWQARCGTARGGTMGRYSQDYVENQWVAVAHCGGKPVAFVTFHVATGDWCLDLMRSTADAPDGTMHALVQAGIDAARGAGATRLSLAANIACPDPASRLWRALSRWAVARSGDAGLRQFKSSFAPTWSPRYVAAPGPLSLALGLADIAREIHRPAPLAAPDMQKTHKDVDEYELASRKAA
ncbi:MAG: phosphatidylglycerol lysyltransferase domain-containing protein [Pseudomonadota bacterium]